MGFKLESLAWDRRTFRYAFSTPPGSSGTRPQTMTVKEVSDALRLACDEWSTVDVQLGFEEVGLPDNPDIIIEFVPNDHSEQAKQDTSGAWLLPDEYTFGSGPAYAHSDYPPKSAGGNVDGVDDPTFTVTKPPIRIHFNDEDYTWDSVLVVSVVLHELGHNLGLAHFPESELDDPEHENAVMEDKCEFLVELQPDDKNAIRKVYGVPGPERFNWIWMAGTVPRKPIWAYTSGDIDTTIDDYKKEGYRLQKLNAYVLAPETLYNAVFDQSTERREYVKDATREEFDKAHARWRGQGLKLIDVNTFVRGDGEVRFTGVWATKTDDIRADIGIALSALKSKLDHAHDDQYRPILINGYETPAGEQLWNLLLIRQGEQGDPREWEAHPDLTWDEFDSLSDQLQEQFEPTYLHTLALDGGREQRWSGIWEDIQVASEWGANWIRTDFERHTPNIEKEDDVLQVWDVNAFVRPSTPTTTTLASLSPAPTGLHPLVLGLALDAQRVYATRFLEQVAPPNASNQQGVLVVLDRQTLQPVPELPQFGGLPRGIPVGFEPYSVAVNPITGKIFVANRSPKSYSLTVIDGNTMKVQKTIPLGQVPRHVAVNTKTNRVYVSNVYQQLIHVIDGATLQQLEPIKIGPGPQGLAVDETTNTLYIALANHASPPFVNGLGVVIDDPAKRQILPIVPILPIGIDSVDVAVDPAHNRLYVANQGNVGSGPPSVSVIDRSTLTVLQTVLLPRAVRNLSLNSDAREVYVATDAAVDVIDATTLTLSRTISTGTGPWAIAAAGGTARQVYVGDRRDGSVTRLS
jgi:YVTN family beta-propeller protein